MTKQIAKRFIKVPNWYKMIPISLSLVSTVVFAGTLNYIPPVFTILGATASTIAMLWNVIEFVDFQEIEIKEEISIEEQHENKGDMK